MQCEKSNKKWLEKSLKEFSYNENKIKSTTSWEII
jgi:hypothetical protein